MTKQNHSTDSHSTDSDVPRDARSPGPVVIVGLGYVGLPVALGAVGAGHDVVGVDIDPERIARLARGSSFVEDVTDEELASALATGRFCVQSDAAGLHGASVVVITVPTPLVDGSPDLSAVEAGSRFAGEVVARGSLVILESTSYPGTTEELLVPIVEAGSGLTVGDGLLVAYSPERIDPGNKQWTLSTTPKLVAGVDRPSLDAACEFYAGFVETTVAMAGTREAEMAKLLENTFRHVNIALVNELAISARALGIDVADMLSGAATKPFGFMGFTPGPGVGGHCLPVDPVYLSWQFEQKLGAPTRFIEVANDINRGMADHVVQRLLIGLNERRKSMNGSRILVVGVAYKKNTGDARETPATPIIRRLVDLGADVHVLDRLVAAYELDDIVERVEHLDPETVDDYDTIVLLADHDDVDYSAIEQAACFVFDTRYRLHGPNVEAL